MESSQEGRLGLKTKTNFKWKGKTFSQVTSVIQKNKGNDELSIHMLFRPLPSKIYRKEISSVTNPLKHVKTTINSMEIPGGNIVNTSSTLCSGNEGTANIHYEETKTARACSTGCDDLLTENQPEYRNSKYIQSLSQADNARRRVRSSGMTRPRYNNNKNGRSENYASSGQYLHSRNKTFKQNQFSNLRIGNENATPGSTSSQENEYSSNTIQYCDSNSSLTTYVPVYYKPNNSKFAQQGAVDSGSRLLRLKYDTITQGGNAMREAYGPHTANALAYGVPSNGYTIKDKVGYPNKCTPMFPKRCNNDNSNIVNETT
jgi:hypothetical protein